MMSFKLWAAALSGFVIMAQSALAADLVVQLSTKEASLQDAGCRLYTSPVGFPLKAETAATEIWAKAGAEDQQARIRFEGLSAGTYGVACFIDNNRDGIVNLSWTGRPKEPWGVSKNKRATFRAPRFDEASVSLNASENLAINITLKK
ncbi:MAG: DUF2141 domain-containing protein [Pseudomonadota bacterium]